MKLASLIRFTSRLDQMETISTARQCGCGKCLSCRLTKLIMRVRRIERNEKCKGYCGGGW